MTPLLILRWENLHSYISKQLILLTQEVRIKKTEDRSMIFTCENLQTTFRKVIFLLLLRFKPFHWDECGLKT